MKQNLAFKTATSEDLDSIMEIINDAKQALKSKEIDQWQDGYPNRDSIIADIKNEVGTIATIDGQNVGYAAIVFTGEPTYQNLQDGRWISLSDYVVVHRLCIRNGFTNQGYANKMILHAEQLARERNIKSFKIDTHADNQKMQTLLKKNGFGYCGIIYYDHGKRMAFEKLI